MSISASPVHQVVVASPSATSFPVSLGFTPANGNFLTIEYDGGANTTTISSIAQTGAIWQRATRSIGVRCYEIWYAESVSGAASSLTITLSTAPGVSGGVTVSEWSGLTTGTLDAAGTSPNNGNSTTPATTTVTPTAGREALIIAGARLGGAVVSGPTGGFTALTAEGTRGVSGYQVVASTTGSYGATWTAGTGTWESCIATFLAPSSGPTGAVTGAAVAAAAAQELLAGGAVGVSLATASAQELVAAVASGIATATAAGQELALGVAIGSAVSTAAAQELLGATAVGVASISADSAGNGGAVSGTASLAASAIELLLGAVVGDGTVQATADGGAAAVGGTGPGRGGYLHERRWRKKQREELLLQERVDAAELAALNAAIAAGDAEHEADRLARIAAKDEAKRSADAAREARIVARAAAKAARDAEIEAERLLEEQRSAQQMQDDEDDIRLVYWLTAY